MKWENEFSAGIPPGLQACRFGETALYVDHFHPV
jgi:hypothetical protein